ncbi:hypothetical protein PIB30_096791 [Stylosanthes scabra]|uniref:Uncharacterized protein n=1 Tax=Stylosanthes scabra TaxID=79078 RepID=A0ABU6UWC3_9FABA|nr:hypothetical protein [Stylosanthes scabra]
MEKLEVATIGTQAETTSTCGLCGGPHENHQCYLVKEDQPIEQRNHPNLGWGGNQNPKNGNFQNCPPYQQFQRPPFQPPQPVLPNLQSKPPQPNSFEAALEKLTLKTSEFVQTTNNFIEEARANFRSQDSAIRNLETQVGQIAKQLSTPLPNAFPSDTQVNPKGESS